MEFTEGQAKAALSLVSTIPEVCKRWKKTRKAVEMRIWQDDIIAEQKGNIWFVFLPSVRSIWGDEINESEN